MIENILAEDSEGNKVKPMHYWMGVASRDHVQRGVEGDFCQIDHGKAGALHNMSAGDRLIYYSPRSEMKAGDPVQSFTAIGTVQPGEPYPFDLRRFRAVPQECEIR